MEIGDWSSESDSAYFIAEAGVNHNGDLSLARRLVDAAADAGADAVKFQTFRADEIVTDSAPTAEYQEDATEGQSQHELLADLELDTEAHESLMKYCGERGIEFLSTPFGFETASFLESLEVGAYKVGSGDLTNHPLLRQIASYGRPMIVSTGMSSIDEVRSAFQTIKDVNPDVPVALLHCVSAYPTPLAEVNLRAIDTLADEFGVPIGFSDHTTAVEMPALSVTAGARIVEKHFTLDRALSGPDQTTSLEPDELTRAVSLVRDATDVLGDGTKQPTPAEEETRNVSRKGLFAANRLEAGDRITKSDVAIKRPPTGLPPTEFEWVVGRRLVKPASPDDPLTGAHFGKQ
ncbi:N-acetylneuraminate synthase [Halobacterium jilantaiense]|uniref:N-acetylneuraminate synthase n=1 Tax=Halobacterium jilantaiense TaxID=355548 RepID=A0A1I0MU08_9EURY|nr:N-acetylneuraminate synthase [Halobacterium jilantaiense]SEV91766.1 N-acetylneuraminate synthase [Halobacterium jilantaiense]